MRNTFFSRSAAAAARAQVHAGVPDAPGGTAVYTLADPRDVRCPRYVGQTRDPYARFAQHVRTARLSLPDTEGMDARGRAMQGAIADEGMDARGRAMQGAIAETLWWVRSPKHRPLYLWIRELHRDGGRLPFMCVEEWVDSGADRAAIMRWLAQGAALLNVEAAQLGEQLPLL
jgi:hypothetical protein